MKKKLIALFLILALASSSLVTAARAEEAPASELFSDISGHWAIEAIIDACTRGIINGYPDGTFRPDAFITRAEAVTIINRFFSFSQTGETGFTDVSPDAWYYEQIACATGRGYISGMGDGTFAPDAYIIRLHAFLMLYTIIGSPEVQDLTVLGQFTDAGTIPDDKPEYAECIAYFAGNGMLAGYPDKTLRVSSQITRAEFLTFLKQFSGIEIDQDETPLGDFDLSEFEPLPSTGGGGGSGGDGGGGGGGNSGGGDSGGGDSGGGDSGDPTPDTVYANITSVQVINGYMILLTFDSAVNESNVQTSDITGLGLTIIQQLYNTHQPNQMLLIIKPLEPGQGYALNYGGTVVTIIGQISVELELGSGMAGTAASYTPGTPFEWTFTAKALNYVSNLNYNFPGTFYEITVSKNGQSAATGDMLINGGALGAGGKFTIASNIQGGMETVTVQVEILVDGEYTFTVALTAN